MRYRVRRTLLGLPCLLLIALLAIPSGFAVVAQEALPITEPITAEEVAIVDSLEGRIEALFAAVDDGQAAWEDGDTCAALCAWQDASRLSSEMLDDLGVLAAPYALTQEEEDALAESGEDNEHNYRDSVYAVSRQIQIYHSSILQLNQMAGQQLAMQAQGGPVTFSQWLGEIIRSTLGWLSDLFRRASIRAGAEQLDDATKPTPQDDTDEPAEDTDETSLSDEEEEPTLQDDADEPSTDVEDLAPSDEAADASEDEGTPDENDSDNPDDGDDEDDKENEDQDDSAPPPPPPNPGQPIGDEVVKTGGSKVAEGDARQAPADRAKVVKPKRGVDELLVFTVSGFEGRVTFQRAPDQPWIRIRKRHIRRIRLRQDTRIITGFESAVTLTLVGANVEVSISPNSQITITKYLVPKEDPNNPSPHVDVKYGGVKVYVSKDVERTDMRVVPPNYTAGVTGTEFSIWHDDATWESAIHVVEGSVEITDHTDGTTYTIAADDPPERWSIADDGWTHAPAPELAESWPLEDVEPITTPPEPIAPAAMAAAADACSCWTYSGDPTSVPPGLARPPTAVPTTAPPPPTGTERPSTSGEPTGTAGPPTVSGDRPWEDTTKTSGAAETSTLCSWWIGTDQSTYTLGDRITISYNVCQRSDVSLVNRTPDGQSHVYSQGRLDPGTYTMTGSITEPVGTERIELWYTPDGGSSTLAGSTSFLVQYDEVDDPGDVASSSLPTAIRSCTERLGYDTGQEARDEGWTYGVSANCIDCCLPCFETQMGIWVNSQLATPAQSLCAQQVWSYYQQAPESIRQEIARIYAVAFWQGYR